MTRAHGCNQRSMRFISPTRGEFLAALVRLLGDLDLAEEALDDAFCVAGERWPVEGLPANPCTWLVELGYRQALDRLRQQARFDASVRIRANGLLRAGEHPVDTVDEDIADERLSSYFSVLPPGPGA